MKIYPYVFYRKCLLLNNQDFLNVPKNLTKVKQKIYELDHAILQNKNKLIQLLDELRPENSNKFDILNLKNSILFDKVVKEKHLEKIQSDEIKNLIKKNIALKNELRELIVDFSYDFDLVYLNNKLKMKELFLKENMFSNGVLMASISLYDGIKKWEPSIDKKKSRQIKDSFLSYLTRSVYKPTPFSTLTSIGIINLSNESNTLSEDSEIKSNIRLNSKLLVPIKSLIIHNRELHSNFVVNLNPSVRINEQKSGYKFFINLNNYEFFKEIKSGDFLDSIYKILNTNNNLKYSEVENLLIERYDELEGGKSYVIKNLYQLLLSGFLILELEVNPNSENWSSSLYSRIKKLPNSEIKFLLEETISLLVNNKLELENSYDTTLRKKVLEESSNKLEDFFNSLKRIENENKLELALNYNTENYSLANKLYLEDSKIETPLNYEEVSFKDLEESTNEMAFLFTNKNSKLLQNVKNFFKSTFSLESSIPLLEFYELYSKNCFEAKNQSNGISTDLKPIDYNVVKFDEENGHLFFELNAPDKFNESCFSASATFQINQKNNSEKEYMINILTSGYGRPISRFFYMFNEDCVEKQREFNLHLENNSQDKIFAEVVDSAIFNVNIYDPLFSYQCLMPGGNLGDDSNITKMNIIDLNVRINKEDNISIYDQKTNKEVFFHNSSLQALKGRSNIFNFLLRFSNREHTIINAILLDINDKYRKKNNEGIFEFPRIYFKDKFVFQRKFWIIHHNSFPELNNENKYIDFLELNKWIKNHNFPSQCFITLNFEREKESIKGDFEKNDYKPNYIDFENPLFLEMIKKIFKKNKPIKISEIFPSKNDTDKHTTEYILQWNVNN